MTGDSDLTPERYYDAAADAEADRLQATPTARMEFDVTCLELESTLPDTGHVLDAGGGPGRYSVWLADLGYDVTHCDLSREQVRLATDRVTENGVEDRVRCGRADLRALPYERDVFDGVCCLGGPISHILDPTERQSALQELGRVAKPDAPIFVAVMGRLAALRDIIKHVLPEESPPYGLLKAIQDDGRYTQARVDAYRDGEGWAATKFFRAAELETECEAAGLGVDRLVGLEGIASNLAPELDDVDEDALRMVRDVVTEHRMDRAVVDNAEHMLAVCSPPPK